MDCTSLGRMARCGCPSWKPISASVVTVSFVTLRELKELDVIPHRWSDEGKTVHLPAVLPGATQSGKC